MGDLTFHGEYLRFTIWNRLVRRRNGSQLHDDCQGRGSLNHSLFWTQTVLLATRNKTKNTLTLRVYMYVCIYIYRYLSMYIQWCVYTYVYIIHMLCSLLNLREAICPACPLRHSQFHPFHPDRPAGSHSLQRHKIKSTDVDLAGSTSERLSCWEEIENVWNFQVWRCQATWYLHALWSSQD